MKKSKIANRKSNLSPSDSPSFLATIKSEIQKSQDPRSATACRRNSKELPSPELLKEKLIEKAEDK